VKIKIVVGFAPRGSKRSEFLKSSEAEFLKKSPRTASRFTGAGGAAFGEISFVGAGAEGGMGAGAGTALGLCASADGKACGPSAGLGLAKGKRRLVFLNRDSSSMQHDLKEGLEPMATSEGAVEAAGFSSGGISVMALSISFFGLCVARGQLAVVSAVAFA
jgi:hypothetical protein